MTWHLFARRNLLPYRAYGRGTTRDQRRRIDAILIELAWTIPTEPGTYTDSQNDVWVLGRDQRWTDHAGRQRSRAWTPMLAVMGPFTRISPLTPGEPHDCTIPAH